MNKPRIVCAANKFLIKYSPNEIEELMIAGPRHWDSVMYGIWDKLDDYLISCIDRNSEEQGFVDQFGKFYTRKEAYIILLKRIIKSLEIWIMKLANYIRNIYTEINRNDFIKKGKRF